MKQVVAGAVFTSRFRDGQAQSEREVTRLETLGTHPHISTGILMLNQVTIRTVSAAEKQSSD